MSELQVGREMDTVVAKALGWQFLETGDTEGQGWGWIKSDGSIVLISDWMPSQSDTDAIEALRIWIRQNPTAQVMIVWNGHQWQVNLTVWPEEYCMMSDGRSIILTEAICRAIIQYHNRSM